MTTHIHYSRWFKKEPTVHTRTAWHVFLVLVEFKTVVRLASLRFLIIEFLFFSSWILLSAAKAHISQRSQKKKKKEIALQVGIWCRSKRTLGIGLVAGPRPLVATFFLSLVSSLIRTGESCVRSVARARARAPARACAFVEKKIKERSHDSRRRARS